MVDRNLLYDFGDEGEPATFDQKWGGLPVEAPQFNYTPRSSLVQSVPKLTGNFKDADDKLDLTPEERSLYKRHLDNLNGPGGVDNPDGSRSSLYQAVQEHNGKFYNIPTVWNGKREVEPYTKQDGTLIDVPNATALANVEKEGWNKFPSYSTPDEADERYDKMHQFMEKDTADYMKSKQPKFKLTPVEGDPFSGTMQMSDQSQVAAPLRKLFGLNGEKRYQTWPERALRSGLSAPLDALTGKMQVNDPETGMPTDEAIRRSQDVASVGGPGGLMNLREEGVLGSHGGNLMQPTPKVAAPFYSAVEHAVSNIKQDKMPADQWLGTLTNSKGVKPEELDWTGLKDHLSSKGKEPVTKQEVQDYVNANKVELKEVNKLDNRTKSKNDLVQENMNRGYSRQEAEETADRQLNEGFMSSMYPTKETRFSDPKYQLPGGENYKEMLMTLPNRLDRNEANLADAKRFVRGELNGDPAKFGFNTDEKIMAEAERRGMIGQGDKQYISSHWPDDPNPIAHVRTNDRNITAPGEATPKKSLHIEEIQSDFLQAHRNEQAKIVDAVNKDFDGIADRMVKAGVIKKICDE